MGLLSERGHFHYQLILGEHSSDPAQVALDRHWFGLPWSALYLYGSLRDDEGTLYTVLRVPESGGGGRQRFILHTTLCSDDLRVHEKAVARHGVPISSEPIGKEQQYWRVRPMPREIPSGSRSAQAKHGGRSTA